MKLHPQPRRYRWLMATEGRDGMWPFYVAHIPVNGPKHTHAYTGCANGLSGFTN